MFSVEGTTITISRGDTGAIKFTANATRRDTGAAYTFGERDRAVFSIKAANGQTIKEKSYQMRNNIFTVVFTNSDTDNVAPGGFSWDTRYVINPYYDTDPPVYDESDPTAPWPSYSDLTFPVAMGTKCMHEGTYYFAGQAIQSSETWDPDHWVCADTRVPADGDQVITPNTPMTMNLLTVVGEI